MKKIVLFLLPFLFFVKPIFAATYPSPTGFVNDFAGVLNSSQKSDLENNLQTFQKNTGNEISIAIMKSLNGDTIENAAVKIFEEWKIGQKDKDNGVLLLVAIDDHKLRIEVGYGLEPVLTDAKSGDIIRNQISPKFKQNDYYGGLKNGIEAIQNNITNPNESSSETKNTNTDSIKAVFGILAFLAWILVPLLIYVAAFFGRSKHIWPGAVVGLIIGLIIAGITGAVVSGLVGLFLDWLLSKNYERLKAMGKKTGWKQTGGGFWGGWGTGSGGGSGGFGGFSGGSSGGGGSSGSW